MLVWIQISFWIIEYGSLLWEMIIKNFLRQLVAPERTLERCLCKIFLFERCEPQFIGKMWKEIDFELCFEDIDGNMMNCVDYKNCNGIVKLFWNFCLHVRIVGNEAYRYDRNISNALSEKACKVFSFAVVFGGVRREYWKYWILAQKCDFGKGVCTHDELHGNHKCLCGLKFHFESSSMVSCCGKWLWKTFCGNFLRELWKNVFAKFSCLSDVSHNS